MSAFDKILLSDGVTELANVKRVTFRETVNAGQDLAPGCVGSASIEVEVFGVQATAVQGGDTLYYYQVDENNTDTLIGEFTAAPVIKSKGLYKFTAYDNARKLDADFSAWLSANQASFPMSIFDIVDAACTVAGVTLGSASWPLSTETVEAFYANGLTCRDIISYAAELAGRYVKCDENGELIFSWYTSIPAVTVYPTSGTGGGIIRIAYKQDGLDYSNYTVPAVTHVAVHPSGVDDAAYVYPTVGAQTNVMHIRNNLLLTGADASLFNAAAQQIYTAMSSVGAYRTCTAQLFPKESPFRAGDKTQVTDIQGVSFNTPIMSYTTTATAATIESTGNEVREDNPNTEKAIAQLASDVVRINKLKVDWASINQAVINVVEANELKSSDFVPANDGIFAESGMEIDLANKTIKATDFAVTENGKLYATEADLSGVTFHTAEITTSNLVSLSSVEGAYTMMANAIGYRDIKTVGISGLTRNTVDARFEYYEGTTLVGFAEQSNMPRASFYIPLGPNNADKVRIGLKLKSGESNIRLSFVIVTGTTTFVTYPANANVTFADGISVDGVTVNASFLNSLIPGQKATVSAGGSNTIDIGLDTRGVLFTSSRSTAHRGAYLWVSAPSGNFVITPILAASSLNITGASGVMTITSTASSGYAAYALCISF